MYDYTNLTGSSDLMSSTGGILAAIAGFGFIMAILLLVVSVFMLICMWKIFTKAGKPGWATLIPVYNIIVLIQIANLPLWYIALLIVPAVNIYAIIKIFIEIAHHFGKSTGFGILTALLPIVGLPMLAFSKNNLNQANTFENTNLTNNISADVTSINPQPQVINPQEENNLSFNQPVDTQINNPTIEVSTTVESSTVSEPQMVTPMVQTIPTQEPVMQPVQEAPVESPVVPEPSMASTPIQVVPTQEPVMQPVQEAPVESPVVPEPSMASTPIQVVPTQEPVMQPVQEAPVESPVAPEPQMASTPIQVVPTQEPVMQPVQETPVENSMISNQQPGMSMSPEMMVPNNNMMPESQNPTNNQ